MKIGSGSNAMRISAYLLVLFSACAQAVAQGQVASFVRPDAVTVASRPVVSTTQTLTYGDVQKRAREFGIRQWAEGYEKRGRRNPACDAEVMEFIRVWNARNYGGPEATHTLSLEDRERSACQRPELHRPAGVDGGR